MSSPMRNKYFKIISLSIYAILYCCVEPPEYDDGLLKNIPAIVNESDYFSFSINAEDYSKSHSWDLSFNAFNTDTLYTSLVIKDYTVSLSDSTYIKLYNSNNATIFDILINQEATSIDDIAIEYIGNPNRLEFIANKFNGRIDLQLIKQ
tara:strand:- start:372 stop:818 length:447 start_codon:yes stop_codon:yes gene_type:complete